MFQSGLDSYQNGGSRKSTSTTNNNKDFVYADDKEEGPVAFLKQHFFKLLMVVSMVTAVVLLSSSASSSSNSSLTNQQMTSSSSSSASGFKKKGFKSEAKFFTNKKTSKAANLSPALTIQTPGYSTSLAAAAWLPWDVIAEPAKDQLLSLTVTDPAKNESIPLADNDIAVAWTIDGSTYSGTTTTFKVDKVGVYRCTVQLYASKSTSTKAAAVLGDTSLTYTYTFTLATKYIRRELRSLSDSDRETILDAIKTLYTTDDTTGKALYGEKYVSMETFLYYHLKGAGTSDCDHWHDGAGIVTHHVAVTLAFEQSLQSINPSIALPYWEYSYDAMVYDDYRDSPFFYDDWFGNASPDNDDHVLTAGRFANIAMPNGTSYASAWSQSETGSLNPYSNPYGYMRTPWNMNKSPYFGRHNLTYGFNSFSTLPTCTDMKNCYTSISLSDVFQCSNGQTHGPSHIKIGGSWTTGKVWSDYTFQENDIRVLLFKILWRTGITRCDTSCDLTDTDCKCAIPDSYFEKYNTTYLMEKALIKDTIEYILSTTDDDGDLSEDDYIDILRSVENADQAGEMFTSAAPYDPTFWPLHGTIERLLGYKRMNVDLYGLDFDETWAYPDYDASNGAYLNGVCDWSNVSSEDDFPTCTEGETCSGHYSDDLLEFGNFLNEDETYTNEEFYTFIHPWNDELTYIYDSYDFDYCEETGVDFFADDDNSGAATGDDTASMPASSTVDGNFRMTKFSKTLPKYHQGKKLIGKPHSFKYKPSKKTPEDLVYLKRKNKTMKRTKRNGPGMLEQMMKRANDAATASGKSKKQNHADSTMKKTKKTSTTKKDGK